jgi:Ca2+-binding RTX toxin-like protein
VLTGGAGADILTGKAGNDTLTGGAGNDVLKGGAGADLLNAGDGADWLHGGLGADTMTGGAGADRFVFGSPDDGVDLVTDFTAGDVLDLHALLGHAGSTAAQLSGGGYLRAIAVTGGVQVQVDEDGGGNGYEALVTLQNATVSGLGTDYVFA